MEATPINSAPCSDLQPAVDDRKTPNLPEADVTIAQLPASKTPPVAPLTPSSELTGKRKRLKPTRLHFSAVKSEKKRSCGKYKGVRDSSSKSLSSGKENATKETNALAQISKTMIRAREIQSTLGNERPSFIKTMLKSHVIRGFWMGLPTHFCKSFLPIVDSSMVIKDENGEQYNLKFIAYSCGLSGGWRTFSIKHKLREGDVLIFQLLESCKFKVYIVRRNDSKEVDGAVNVITNETRVERKTQGKRCSSSLPSTKVKRKYTRSKPATQLSSNHTDHHVVNSQVQGCPPEPRCSSSLPLTKVKRKYKRSKPPTQLSSDVTDHPVVNAQVQGSPPEPNLSLKDVKTFKHFHIMVDKQCIDSELSEEIRKHYYNLCIGKNEILHGAVREGLYYKLVAGVIGETVNIANMIKNCKLTTSKEEFAIWDSSLESFELIGMKVGFLRDRIRELKNLSFESEDAKGYVEAKEEQTRNANEIKVLEAKLLELYGNKRKIDGVVDGLKEKAEVYEIEFQKKVDAPW